MRRLKVLAEVINAPLPSAEALKRLAGSVGRFSEDVIEKACARLENAPQGEYKRLPTPHELQKACEEAQAVNVPVTRWCGRCRMGLIRGSDGDFRRCECSCVLCDNSGWIQEARPVKNYAKPITYAKRCPNGCKAHGSETAA